jgi:hypothetical protein
LRGGGAKQQEAFENIKEYLVYIAMQEWVIGAVLLQEEDGKEFPVAYVS